MTEIGATLREARMRAKVDITDVEMATKIRAKYLRALENEEWSLLPGPTFVKSFLRTYAEYLGLDARLLVDEYRARYEAPAESELSPIRPPGPRERGRIGRGGPPVPPRAALIGLLLLAIVVALYALGTWGGSSNSPPPAPSGGAAHPGRHHGGRGAHRARHASSLATLAILPAAPVYVCLVDAAGRRLVPGQILSSPSRRFKSHRFLLTLGNGQARMRVNGRVLSVPSLAVPISFEVTPRGRRPLAASRAPRCA
jgi:hypothetical protein